MDRRKFLVAGSTAMAMATVGSTLSADSTSIWPGWRGPNRDGYSGTDAWPASLDESHLKKQWDVALDDSYSGPIVSPTHVIVTETVAKKDETTRALERATGKETWIQKWPGSITVPFFAASNGSWIRSTPAIDDQSVFVGGIRDVLLSLDLATGKENFRIDFAELAGGKVPDFGMVCSPLIDGDSLYVQAGLAVYKLDRKTGKQIWSSMKDTGDIMSSGAFSSPIIAELNGKRQLIVQTRTTLAGLDLDSGEPIWKYEVAAFRGMNILTPTVWDNAIFTSSYGGRSLLLDVQQNGKWSPKVRWDNKIEGYMSSPVIVGDHAYMHLRNQRFACLNLKSGKETWTTRPFGKYWSMVTNGLQILALDQTGNLRLINANPEKFEQVSEREVSSEESWAHLAIADQQLFVRHQKGISVYQWA